MLCCIHGHIILRAVVGVIEIEVFGLPIYRFDGHVDGLVGRCITRAVVH
jgi:hypothetical protein